MDSRTQERVERWDSAPFSGGYDGLRDLAEADFSGAVSTGTTWLFMLNGRVVGVVDGRIEDFDGAAGTMYDAPDPSLPLLCSMEERGGETRGRYYTNKTPIEEVDRTLRDGSFTGYLELSERVLSGDYYLVYYGGRRMAAAYIGNAERLLTDDEAFERAADEVGIYEVVDVEVEVTDVPGSEPEPEPEPTTASEGTAPQEPRGVAAAEPEITEAEPDAAKAESDVSTAEPAVANGDPKITEAEPESPEVEPERLGDRAEPNRDPQAGADGEAASGVGDGRSEPPSGRADTGPEPDADPDPRSAADSRSEREPASERAGITTSDDGSAEPTSPGITDTTRGEDDVEPMPAADEPSGSDESSAESAADRSGAEPAADRSGAEPMPAPDSTEDDDEPIAVPPTDERPDAERESGNPTPEEVERAAEELGAGGVPWADETDDSQTDDSVEPSSASDEELDERFKQEERWRETRSIPSLDPDHSETDGSRDASGARRGSGARTGSRTRSNASSRSKSDAATDSTVENASATGTGSAGGPSGSTRKRSRSNAGRADAERRRSADRTAGASGDADSETLESDMLEREDKIDRLTQRVDELAEKREELKERCESLQAERDRLESENGELSATVDRLQGRIQELEAELERLRSADAAEAPGAAAPDGRREMTPREALSGTNLFIRYESKSQPTLRTAHEGEADRAQVASNLRIEHHTQFDESHVAVDGRAYGEFLRESMEYRFVEWLVGTLLYEIRDTGRADGLADLYDASPRVDRAELHASISLEDDETDEVPEEVRFDVVAFDKRGTPLVVANLNDSRDPASKRMLETMEEEASAVNANYPDLGAAFVVTSSFFEPGALEVAELATSGGFLSRSSKLSYVNLSRKQGYHLCLVESRSGGFHVNVPEL